MARRQRDTSIATAALAGVALEDIARAVPELALLPVTETKSGAALQGQQRRSGSDIRVAAEAARRQHRTDSGRDQFFQRARARAARIMLANWPSVTAVAEALLEHGELGGDDVERLMRISPRNRGNRLR